MTVQLVRSDQDFQMTATSEEGHTAVADGSLAIGAKNTGMRPMEMVLAAVGSCSAIDVVLLLRKQRQPLDDLRIKVTGQRREEAPRIFTDIHVSYEIIGTVADKKAERACRLSMEKMCSVSMMLKAGGVRFTWDYTVSEASATS